MRKKVIKKPYTEWIKTYKKEMGIPKFYISATSSDTFSEIAPTIVSMVVFLMQRTPEYHVSRDEKKQMLICLAERLEELRVRQ